MKSLYELTLKHFFFHSFRKIIEIPIEEEDSYEKNVVMYCCIGEPRHIAGRGRERILWTRCLCVQESERETKYEAKSPRIKRGKKLLGRKMSLAEKSFRFLHLDREERSLPFLERNYLFFKNKSRKPAGPSGSTSGTARSA